MQINLFVRSTGLVSALFGAVGHRRALPSAAAQRAAARGWAPSRGEGEQSLQSAGQRTSAAAKCPAAFSSSWDWLHFPRAQRSDQFVFNPGQGTRSSASFMQKLWQWAYALLQAPAVSDGSWLWSCSAQKAQCFRACSSLTSEMSRVPQSNALSHGAAVRHVLAVRFGCEAFTVVWLEELQYPLRFKP